MPHAHAHAAPVPHTATPPARAGRGPSLDVSVARVDATHVELRLRGEMDMANADVLGAVVTRHLRRNRRYIRLDLRDLEFVDCAGLRAIVEAHNQCLAAHGRLVLTGARPLARRMLAITQLDQALFLDDAQPDGKPPARRSHLAPVPAHSPTPRTSEAS